MSKDGSPEISVIIPTHNPNIGYLERSIQSVLQQTFREFELIVVDDGSSDELHAQIIELARMDERIVPLTQVNKGVSAARNNGISHARGKYLAFVDDDDIVSPYFLEESREVLISENCDMVIGGVIRRISDILPPEALSKGSVEYKVLTDGECREYIFNILSSVKHISHGAYIGRGPHARLLRNNIENILFPEDMVYREDAIWNYKLLMNLRKVALVDRVWYLYVRHNSSVTMKCCPDALKQAEKAIAELDKLDLFTDHDIKAYGDYVFYTLVELDARWFNHPECPLTELEKIRTIRTMARRDPWRVLSSKSYLKTVSKRRKLQCILFHKGLISTFWKYRR